MFEDDYRYEDEADDFEYIDDDEEEDENSLWDDEDAVDAEIDGVSAEESFYQRGNHVHERLSGFVLPL